MRTLRRILPLIALLGTALPGTVLASPPLTFRWTGPPAPERFTGYGIVLRGPSGLALWMCRDSPPFRPEPCPPPPSNWFSSPGEYRIAARIDRKGGSAPLHLERPFRADGREIVLELSLSALWLRPGEYPDVEGAMATLDLHRILPAPPEVRLRPAGRGPGPGAPTFLLENGTSQTLHGAAIWGNFFGSFEQWKDGAWRHFDRGGFCGTVPEGKPLPPGGWTASFEGAFIGEPQPFEPGRKYRYLLRYSTTPRPWTRPSSKDPLRSTLLELYQVNVLWSPPRPPKKEP
jgi:hypothetical protein